MEGKHTVIVVAILIIVTLSILIVLTAVVRCIGVAVGVRVLGAVVVGPLVVLLGAEGVVWVGGRRGGGVAIVTTMP